MKKQILAIAACFTILCNSHAQGFKTPAPSSTQTIKQDFGLGSIELSYSRPNAKGRVVFGDLTPYGKVWRTGANGATTLTFGDEVIIGDKKIPAGKYGLLSIPGKTSWTLIITKQLDVTSPAAYKQEEDVVRVTVPSTALAASVETFTMQFVNIKSTSCDLQLMWEKTSVKLPIKTDIDARIMEQIGTAMKSDNANKPYFGAAMYYMETGRDAKQADEWFGKAAEQNPKAYWVLYQQANCKMKLGNKKEAAELAKRSMEAAKEGKNDDYVALNKKLLAKLK
ncbi:MAG: DUF2911 domain-containing protein [Chitinophagaceae bacterium]